MGSQIWEYFTELDDPRLDRTKKHDLIDIIAIAICGVICGADNWTEIEQFGQVREAWLRRLIALPNGIPSHDTFGRVFGMLDGKQFAKCFSRWVRSIHKLTQGQVVAIDGKTVRRSRDKGKGQDAVHLISAWACDNELVLGQVKVPDDSNEIPHIPKLLKLLDLHGCIVTVDAMGCQKDIAKAIREAKADYLLRVKKNQKQLFEDLELWFMSEYVSDFVTVDYAENITKGHGRIEVRKCWAISDPLAFEYIQHYEGWKDLHSIAKVVRERRIRNQVQQDTAYYISSLSHNANAILNASRHHWHIENKLHWLLDIGFREDESRYRAGNGAENFAVLRKLAINLIRRDKSVKIGAKGKRLRAAMDSDYLLHLLSQ